MLAGVVLAMLPEAETHLSARAYHSIRAFSLRSRIRVSASSLVVTVSDMSERELPYLAVSIPLWASVISLIDGLR